MELNSLDLIICQILFLENLHPSSEIPASAVGSGCCLSGDGSCVGIRAINLTLFHKVFKTSCNVQNLSIISAVPQKRDTKWQLCFLILYPSGVNADTA